MPRSPEAATQIGSLGGRWRRNIQRTDQGCESRASAWVRGEDTTPVHRATDLSSQHHLTAHAAVMAMFPMCAVSYDCPTWMLNNGNEAYVTEKLKLNKI